MTDRISRLSALLTVGAQSGFWRLWSGPRRYLLAFLWHIGMPGAVRLLGYFPSKRLGFGENLPGGVAREWARWCRHPDYMIDAHGQPLRPHFDDFDKPLLAYSISDDGFAPRSAVEALHGFYRNARKTLRHVTPAELGVESIGHFRWLRDPFRSTLWEDMATWLEQQARENRQLPAQVALPTATDSPPAPPLAP